MPIIRRCVVEAAPLSPRFLWPVPSGPMSVSPPTLRFRYRLRACTCFPHAQGRSAAACPRAFTSAHAKTPSCSAPGGSRRRRALARFGPKRTFALRWGTQQRLRAPARRASSTLHCSPNPRAISAVEVSRAATGFSSEPGRAMVRRHATFSAGPAVPPYPWSRRREKFMTTFSSTPASYFGLRLSNFGLRSLRPSRHFPVPKDHLGLLRARPAATTAPHARPDAHPSAASAN